MCVWMGGSLLQSRIVWGGEREVVVSVWAGGVCFFPAPVPWVLGREKLVVGCWLGGWGFAFAFPRTSSMLGKGGKSTSEYWMPSLSAALMEALAWLIRVPSNHPPYNFGRPGPLSTSFTGLGAAGAAGAEGVVAGGEGVFLAPQFPKKACTPVRERRTSTRRRTQRREGGAMAVWGRGGRE